MSRLSIVHALASDAGNYTCGPDMVTPDNVTVYVVEGEVIYERLLQNQLKKNIEKKFKVSLS